MDVFAPLVISDAGIINTFTTLLPPQVASKSSEYSISMPGHKENDGHDCDDDDVNIKAWAIVMDCNERL